MKTRELKWRAELKDRLDENEYAKIVSFSTPIIGGCSNHSPDVLLDMLSHSIVGECDENGHSGYDELCEKRRLNEMFISLGCRSLVVLRFNPDTPKYKERIEKYISRMKYYIHNVPEETIQKESF